MIKNAVSRAVKLGLDLGIKTAAARLDRDEKKAGVGLMVGGMATLLTGQRLASVTLFAKGVQLAEKRWREAHPEFDGSLKERWEAALALYQQTHTAPANRAMHAVGIPMMVGGAAGLMLTPALTPVWAASAASLVGGFGLSVLGNAVFERSPAGASAPPTTITSS